MGVIDLTRSTMSLTDQQKVDNLLKILDACEQVGITRVAIQTRDPEIKGSMLWSSQSNLPADSICANGTFNGWPAIWSAIEKAKLSGGCGNPGQHQIRQGQIRPTDFGVYQLYNGQWAKLKKIDEL